MSGGLKNLVQVCRYYFIIKMINGMVQYKLKTSLKRDSIEIFGSLQNNESYANSFKKYQ